MARGILQDLTGQRFGRWLVLSRASRPVGKSRGAYWNCQCTCGTERPVFGRNLRNGESGGCGCGRPARAKLRSTTHGQSETTTYSIWRTFRQRCNNPKNDHYNSYGGRGISVCDRWNASRGFANFLTDMGERPSQSHTLDRINNDGNYEPGNCRWATKREQHRNRRNTIRLQVAGEELCATDVAQLCAIHQNTVVRCIRLGLSGDEIVSKYRGRIKRIAISHPCA